MDVKFGGESIGDVYFVLGLAENELFAKNGQWPSEWGQGGKVKLKIFFLKKGSTEYFRNLFSLISTCQSTKNNLDWFSDMTFNFTVTEMTL